VINSRVYAEGATDVLREVGDYVLRFGQPG